MKTHPVIKAFIWDLGGVILRAGDLTHHNPLAICLGAVPQTEGALGQRAAQPADAVEHILVDFIRALKTSYKTALLIPDWQDLQLAFANLWQFEDAFDEIYAASTPDLWKPAPPAFSQALDQLGVSPAETVFVDDDPRNVAAARLLGLHSIRYQNPAQIGSALLNLLAEPVA